MNPMTVVELFGEAEFLVGLTVGAAFLLASWFTSHRIELAVFWAAAAVVAVTIVGVTSTDPPWWGLPLMVITALIVAWNGWRVEEVISGQLMWVLLLLTVFGAWGTVPDTEAAGAALGAAAALTVGLIRPQRAWRGAALGVAALVVGGVALVDGPGRPSSLVGVVGTFGVLLFVGLGGRRSERFAWWVLVPLHVGMIVFEGRVAGVAADIGLASTLAAAGLVATMVTWFVLTGGIRKWPGVLWRGSRKPES